MVRELVRDGYGYVGNCGLNGLMFFGVGYVFFFRDVIGYCIMG